MDSNGQLPLAHQHVALLVTLLPFDRGFRSANDAKEIRNKGRTMNRNKNKNKNEKGIELLCLIFSLGQLEVCLANWKTLRTSSKKFPTSQKLRNDIGRHAELESGKRDFTNRKRRSETIPAEQAVAAEDKYRVRRRRRARKIKKEKQEYDEP